MKDFNEIYDELLFEYNNGGIKSETVAKLNLTKSQRIGLLNLIMAQPPEVITLPREITKQIRSH